MSERKPSCEIHARYSRGCSECHSAEMTAFRTAVAEALAALRAKIKSRHTTAEEYGNDPKSSYTHNRALVIAVEDLDATVAALNLAHKEER